MELSRQYRQMLYRMSLYQTAKEQQLSVGTLPVLSQYHLTGSFRLFQKEHPEISLALTEVEESELMEGIEKKRFAMILARESMIDTEHYHFFPIATDRICVMLPADHPLATRQKLSVTALTDQSFLLMHHTHPFISCVCRFEGDPPKCHTAGRWSESGRFSTLESGDKQPMLTYPTARS